MKNLSFISVALGVVLAGSMSACATRGAPSFVLFGAFFPAWLLLGGIGIGAAIATRLAFVASGLVAVIPLQLLVCASSGLIVAVVCWLLWFEV